MFKRRFCSTLKKSWDHSVELISTKYLFIINMKKETKMDTTINEILNFTQLGSDIKTLGKLLKKATPWQFFKFKFFIRIWMIKKSFKTGTLWSTITIELVDLITRRMKNPMLGYNMQFKTYAILGRFLKKEFIGSKGPETLRECYLYFILFMRLTRRCQS